MGMNYELFMRLRGGVVARFGFEATDEIQASEIVTIITRDVERGWTLGEESEAKIEMSKLRVLGESASGRRPIIVSL